MHQNKGILHTNPHSCSLFPLEFTLYSLIHEYYRVPSSPRPFLVLSLLFSIPLSILHHSLSQHLALSPSPPALFQILHHLHHPINPLQVRHRPLRHIPNRSTFQIAFMRIIDRPPRRWIRTLLAKPFTFVSKFLSLVSQTLLFLLELLDEPRSRCEPSGGLPDASGIFLIVMATAVGGEVVIRRWRRLRPKMACPKERYLPVPPLFSPLPRHPDRQPIRNLPIPAAPLPLT